MGSGNEIEILTVTFKNVCRVHTKRQVIIKMNKFNMFITAVCVLFLIKKFVVAENFAELVSKCKRFCLFPKESDSVFPGGWGI